MDGHLYGKKGGGRCRRRKKVVGSGRKMLRKWKRGRKGKTEDARGGGDVWEGGGGGLKMGKEKRKSPYHN